VAATSERKCLGSIGSLGNPEMIGGVTVVIFRWAALTVQVAGRSVFGARGI
jgi:hypothetical protein